jgi:two-component system NtrC family sensor kinase
LGQRVAFDVNELLDRCVELLSHQPLFHDVEFRRELSADLPLILGDPGQVQQVLTNLIINAANAMSGKGRLTITSSFDAAADEVGLRFADSGPGIAPEIMDKIFEPFFTTKRPGEGTGLGLSVAYGIVQQHGGKIEAANAPQGGAVFTVTLPLESPEDLDEMIIQ